MISKLERPREEPWMMSIPHDHWYQYAGDVTFNFLRNCNGKHCLVVGSPIPEVTRLVRNGWEIDYVDIRKVPEPVGFRTHVADTRHLPFPTSHFDVLSSTCVLCHVGTGRYGDDIEHDGDQTALNEMQRVLRSGGFAVIMFGPFATLAVRMHEIHRIYNYETIAIMCEKARFRMLETHVYEGHPDDYISVILEKI